jgi:fucose 4-O-acetylase-like acetyltransferase
VEPTVINQSNTGKVRDFFWDNFRGILIWTIPISHFTMSGGAYARDSLSGVIYITINVFVMQAFVFLSGYFSKRPERARETAFKTFLFPYLLLVPMFYGVRYYFLGGAHLSWIEVPFALWYLVALFFYRFFLVDMIRFKYILPLSIVLYFAAGQIPWLDSTLAGGRVVSYLPFFLLGYYCKKEHIEKIQSIKLLPTVLLGIFVVTASVVLAYVVPIPSDFYLLKRDAGFIGIEWWADLLMRLVDLVLPCLWIIFMLNIVPKGKSYLTYVGITTMPIYILHLVVRYWVRDTGFPDGNMFVYYGCIIGLASLCVVVFSSKPVAKVYDGFFELTYSKGYLSLKNLGKRLLGKG